MRPVTKQAPLNPQSVPVSAPFGYRWRGLAACHGPQPGS